ncbi:hypothetical protein DPMN_147956 [Dreissena polymorpha]|uniref:Uncharacterized protein n=1 Tax=Dreissena polymorpha TaxID=45954 RepID=A0A9D4F954_DREPO|nr:hypothetical protein DPMN_147956 [Dreissena polymorpha]
MSLFPSEAESQDYAVPDVTKSALMTFPQARKQNNLDKPPPRYDALYAAADIVSTQVPNIPSLQASIESPRSSIYPSL